jgi:hypothetical protein
MNYRHLVALLGVCLCGSLALAMPPPAPQTQQTLPAASLRGYGKISAQIETWPAEGSSVSVTRLDCESKAKAALLHAKYLSDLQALPGVTAGKLSVAGKDLPAWQVGGQGWILACCSDKNVFIVAGDRDTAVAQVAAASLQGLASPTFAPATAVPAYLDKWDRHGWSFYNWLWYTPNKKDFPQLAAAGYDFSKPYNYDTEYQWSAQNHTGMVYWMHQFAHDRGAGMNDYPDMTWAPEACHAHGIDFQIQPTLNDNMPWWANHYRDETIVKMPGYVGNYHSVNEPYMGAAGFCSWCSVRGKDELLALSQQWVQRYADDPSCSTVMEPHCEVAHGEFDLLTEYGPLADASYRRFLQQERRLSLGDVSRRYGEKYASWDQVRVPELAFFLGGDQEALDLTGTWKVKYATQEEGQEQNLFAPDLDTAGWGEIVTPGNDEQMFLEKKPAWFRRPVEIPAAWLAAHPDRPVYLYLWDLNQRNAKSPVLVYWNGKLVATDVRESGIGITIAPLAGALQAGANTLAVYLPQGYIGYRVYLAAHEPVSYPRLGKEMNARWVDFRDWQTWTRVDAIRRGMEAIRGVDPNRPISLAAPEAVIDYAKELAVRYGGFFHNTGYMSAWFGDLQPRMMNSVGLPASAEPGGPAPNLAALKSYWALITLEGVDSYNYFIHIGSIMWDPEMKAWFDSQQPMIHLLGKYHLPATRVAGLAGIRSDRLKGWPWYRDEATIPNGGYWNADVSGLLNVPADLLSERDVLQGMLSKYDLVYDEQTSIMSRELVGKITDWVKAGGTFVTLAQTGRHTEEEPDAWPIATLTGCDVLWTSKVKDTGEYEWKPFTLVPGQKVFDEAFWSQANLSANGVGMKIPGDHEYQRAANDKGQQGLDTAGGGANLAANGLGLKPEGGDVEPLMRWKDDGSLAVGLRQVGKGRVFIVGLKFFNDRPWWGAPELEAKLVNDILAYCGYQNEDDARVNGRLISGQTKLHDAPWGRRFISNNGLYDVYFVCNQGKEAGDLSLSLPAGRSPRAWDVAAQQEVTGQEQEGRLVFTLAGMQPTELRALLVPRGRIAQAPAEWLRLQTGWWQGGGAPGRVLTPDKYDYVEDLTDGWTFTPTDEQGVRDPSGLIANVSLGPWTYLVKQPVQNAVFTRDFTVPAAWKDGNIYLHVSGWVGNTFLDQGRVLLDNREIRGFSAGSVELMLNDTLKPGSTHTVSLQIKGGAYSQGLRGSCWLEYEPRPAQELQLAGQWEPSADALTRTARVPLPGEFDGRMARATIFVPENWKGQTVMIHALGGDTGPALLSVITNGKMCRRHHHIYGPRLDLNITPYLKFGQPNEIEIVANGAGKVQVRELSLRAYPAGSYP